MATTINTYSIGLTLDANDYINKSKLTATETRRLVRSIEEARTPAEKFERDLNRLTAAYQKGAIDAAAYARLTDSARQKMEAADKAAEKLANTQTSAAGAFSALGGHLKGIVAGYVGLQTVTKSVRMAADAEMAAASFEILTGSIEGSRYMLGELRTLAAATPITFTGMQDAAKLMMAFNVPVNEVVGNLEMLSDISMGNQQRFDMLALAFSQASAAGRLMGQDLLQMVNAGFNPLQEISKRTGETLTDLRKRMEAGKIGIDEVKQAFMDATSEGGKFNGMSDKLAETMGGKMAIAASDLEQAYIKLGQAFSSLVITMTSGFHDGASALDVVIFGVEKLSDGLSAIIVLAQDVAHNLKAIATMDSDNIGTAPSIHDFVDFLDARDREREMMKNNVESQNALNGAIVAGTGAMSGMTESTQALGESYHDILSKLELQRIALMHGEETAQRIKLLQSGMTEEQADRILQEQRINDEFEKQKKLQEDLAKIEADRIKQAQEANQLFEDDLQGMFENNVEQALNAARQYFEQEEAKWERMRSEIARSPDAIEAGSGAAASFLAQMENNRIAAAVMGERPIATDEMIAKKAQEQLEEIKQTNLRMDKQYVIFQQLLDQAKENGFKRVR